LRTDQHFSRIASYRPLFRSATLALSHSRTLAPRFRPHRPTDLARNHGPPRLPEKRSGSTISRSTVRATRFRRRIAALAAATGIGSGLAGICYILDEPSIGLHPRDNQRLIDALRDLFSGGSSVLVVEHDEAIMRQADWLIDIGPGAGSLGGYVVAEGTPRQVMASTASITGRYLSGAAKIELPSQRRKAAKSRSIEIEGVTTNNLKKVAATFPLGLLIGISGVSGSGKSSLINETLAPGLIRRLGGVAQKPGPYTSLRGANLSTRSSRSISRRLAVRPKQRGHLHRRLR